MLGWFRFKTHRAYFPDGAIALAEKSGSAVILSDQRLAPSAAIFLEPIEGFQNATLAFIGRERMNFPSQGFLDLEVMSGSNVTLVSAMQALRVVFGSWDAYRFTDIPPGIKRRSAWVVILRALGAQLSRGTGG